ncbi:MAG: TadE/TadG family type IV pilus assembly protein [Candidatus Pristimantibacillus sp.]
MKHLIKLMKKPLSDQKGVTDLIVLLIVLPIFLCITVMIVTFFVFVMKQAKIDDIKDRALQMVQTDGYLSQAIIDDTNSKLESVGIPTVTKNGKTFPSYTGSTTSLVLRDDPDPTVYLKIEYPATDFAKLMAFFGVTTIEDPGYFSLEGHGRSEKYEE